MANAIRLLESAGVSLPQPHAKRVHGYPNLWELRPRQGRSPWRALYRRIGDEWLIGAICADAMIDRPGFSEAAARAVARLDAIGADHRGGRTSR